MNEQEIIPLSSEAGLSLGETTRLLEASWSPDICGFVMVGTGPAELMGTDDVFCRFKHCGNNPSDFEYNLRLKETIIKIATPTDLV